MTHPLIDHYREKNYPPETLRRMDEALANVEDSDLPAAARAIGRAILERSLGEVARPFPETNRRLAQVWDENIKIGQAVFRKATATPEIKALMIKYRLRLPDDPRDRRDGE